MKTKLVSVWHVEYVTTKGRPLVATLTTYELAVRYRDQVAWGVPNTITGPHQHRVPA